MIRSEESKRLWTLAEAARNFEAMDAIEAEWNSLLAQDEIYYENRVDWDSSMDSDLDEWATEDLSNQPWTNEDEAGLEEYEESKRRRIAEANEF